MARRAAPDIAVLEAAIGHVFGNRDNLMRALTHLSALSSQEGRTGSYQRLEFLGDRVLGLVVADMLVETYPDAPEGDLSKRLAALVRRETCAAVADEWGVGPFLRFGGGQGITAGRTNRTILADVCEAVIGAVFLDGGYAAAKALVQKSFGTRMRDALAPPRDAKTALQEWAHGLGRAAPVYREIERSGPDHAPKFRIEVFIEGIGTASALGASKRVAEQAAADAMLRREGVWAEGAA